MDGGQRWACLVEAARKSGMGSEKGVSGSRHHFSGCRHKELRKIIRRVDARYYDQDCEQLEKDSEPEWVTTHACKMCRYDEQGSSRFVKER
jgi:hypothetical protein